MIIHADYPSKDFLDKTLGKYSCYFVPNNAEQMRLAVFQFGDNYGKQLYIAPAGRKTSKVNVSQSGYDTLVYGLCDENAAKTVFLEQKTEPAWQRFPRYSICDMKLDRKNNLYKKVGQTPVFYATDDSTSLENSESCVAKIQSLFYIHGAKMPQHQEETCEQIKEHQKHHYLLNMYYYNLHDGSGQCYNMDVIRLDGNYCVINKKTGATVTTQNKESGKVKDYGDLCKYSLNFHMNGSKQKVM